MTIYPSILEKTSKDLFFQIKKLSPYFNTFQIDIADGLYVSNKTVTIEKIISYLSNHQSLITNHLNFEFHLMVKDYEKEIEKLKNLRNHLNIKNILIHANLSPDYQLLITNFPFFSFGLVLNPEDFVKTIEQKYDLKKIPIIQIMSVVPGAQGNSFIPETLKKIEQLRQANYKNKISLDGGINDKTIPLILSQKFLPDILCPGSFLTKAKNLETNINFLKKIE